jgi:hypothetical protein
VIGLRNPPGSASKGSIRIGGDMSPRVRSGLGVTLLLLVLVIITARAWFT